MANLMYMLGMKDASCACEALASPVATSVQCHSAQTLIAFCTKMNVANAFHIKLSIVRALDG